jgi:hypothetical protein
MCGRSSSSVGWVRGTLVCDNSLFALAPRYTPRLSGVYKNHGSDCFVYKNHGVGHLTDRLQGAEVIIPKY